MRKMDGGSMDVLADRIEKLKSLIPEAISDGKIDFESLRSSLGDEIDSSREHYRFVWNGKEEARAFAFAKSMGTLRPCKDDSKDWDTTKNVYIEGDNLEVLKLLQGSYHDKVKMIYIDPPYNTGKDFVYPDNFRDSIQNYMEQTGQAGEDGRALRANSEMSGRYHTDWLNMMFPRLLLARNLLCRDGVIFISIDDNEVTNLRKLCDEVFGENNFEGHIHWRRRHNQPNDKKKLIGLVAEHIIVYAKDSAYLKQAGVGKLDLTGDFSNPDNDPKGPWASKPWKVGADQSGSRYTITTPSGQVLDEEWMGDETTYKQHFADGRIYFPKGGDGFPRKKYYQFEREEEGQCATNWWPHDLFGHNQGANEELTALMGKKNVFSNPKPVQLLEAIVKLGNVSDDEIVLDFFSGSATMAHSVMQQCAEDGVSRRFILVQLPETINPLKVSGEDAKKTAQNAVDFLDSIGKKHTICEIGKERIRRAGVKIKSENATTAPNLDIGFKVFKLDTSNLIPWNPNPEDIESSLLAVVDNAVPDRTADDLLYEILLKCNLPLTMSIEERKIGDNTIRVVGGGKLMVCLDKSIPVSVAEEMIRLRNEVYRPGAGMQVVFRDSGLTDKDKTNAIMVLKQAGVEEKAIMSI